MSSTTSSSSDKDKYKTAMDVDNKEPADKDNDPEVPKKFAKKEARAKKSK